METVTESPWGAAFYLILVVLCFIAVFLVLAFFGRNDNEPIKSEVILPDPVEPVGHKYSYAEPSVYEDELLKPVVTVAVSTDKTKIHEPVKSVKVSVKAAPAKKPAIKKSTPVKKEVVLKDKIAPKKPSVKKKPE